MIINVYKIPVTVQALLWTGDNIEECKKFAGNNIEFVYPTMDDSVVFAVIHTLEGDMNASVGDFIIRGVDGEFYPCKPAIFRKTYRVAKNIPTFKI